jgi:hypothetical protein
LCVEEAALARMQATQSFEMSLDEQWAALEMLVDFY